MSNVTGNKVLFDEDSRVAPLGLIALQSAKTLGDKINYYLVKWAEEGGVSYDTFLVEA